MQVAVIEFARHVAGLTDAHSASLPPSVPTRSLTSCLARAMRSTRAAPCGWGPIPAPSSPVPCWSGATAPIRSRSATRHRYEFNNQFRDALTGAGLVLGGLSPDGRLVEAVELPHSPFFVGVQYHPEFKSRPNRPHPLFHGFVSAALQRHTQN